MGRLHQQVGLRPDPLVSVQLSTDPLAGLSGGSEGPPVWEEKGKERERDGGGRKDVRKRGERGSRRISLTPLKSKCRPCV